MPPRGGRSIGDKCFCLNGVLIPVLNDTMRIRKKSPRAGHVIDPMIERLACSTCGLNYESVDRGKPIKECREERLMVPFVNPKRFPETCQVCGWEEHGRSTRHGRDGDPDRHYLHCASCHTILWVFSEKPEAPSRVTEARQPILTVI